MTSPSLARPCARKNTPMHEKPKTKSDKVEQNIDFLLVCKQVHLRKSQLKVHRSTIQFSKIILNSRSPSSL
jgi:hypothetical protein